METIEELVKQVLEQGYVMSLATLDHQGLWVADVMYVHDDHLNVYWISKTSTRHSQAIQRCRVVAGSITLSQQPKDPDKGLQFSGLAEQLKNDSSEITARYCQKTGKEHFSLNTDEAWYQLTPTKMELIYEPYFGFEKRIVEF